MTDPWAAAGQNTSPTAEGALLPPPPDGAERALFGGGSLPSMFNKTHGIGDEVTGIVSAAATQRHSRTYVQDGVGDLKYWSERERKPVTDSFDAVTQKQNNPLYDTVVPMSTDYRDPAKPEDDGARAFYLSSNDLKAFRAAIGVAKLTSMGQLVGMRVTGKRTGQVPTGKGNAAWTYAFKIEPVA